MLSDDREHVIVHAVTGNEVAFPTTVPLPEHHKPMLTDPWEYVIHPDLQTDPLEKQTPPGQAGYRGRLLVPIRLQNELVGALDFFSFQPNSIRKPMRWWRGASRTMLRSPCRISAWRRRLNSRGGA